MKIAINARFLLPGKLEGLGWYTREIALRMVQRHPETAFVLLFDRPVSPEIRAEFSALNVQFKVLFPPARHPFLWWLWFEMAVPQALREVGADVFFSPDSFLSLRAKTRTVMTLHDVIPLRSPEQVPFWPRLFYQKYLPKYARRADQLVAISEFTKKEIMETCGVGEGKIAVVPNGCRAGFAPISGEEKQRVRAEFAGGQPYFFYAGTMHPRKNLARLIRAFDAFKTKTAAPAKLLLAGRFLAKTGEITAAWQSAQHRADIQFLGYLHDETLQKLTAAALAVTYVSEAEGFGLPVLEAMHAEVPVLTSNVSALPEVAGEAALLVNPFSENEIAAGLERLFFEEDLRRELVERGRSRREFFSWDLAAERIYNLLIVR